MVKYSPGITTRFALVIVVLLPSLGALAWVGFQGLQSSHSALDSMYSDHLVTIRDVSALEISLDEAEQDGLQLIATGAPAARARLTVDLASRVVPEVDSEMGLVTGDTSDNRLEVTRRGVITAAWAKFQRLLIAGKLSTGSASTPDAGTNLLSSVFDPAIAAAKSLIATEEVEAVQAHEQAQAAYSSNIKWLLLTVALALLAAAGIVGWLIRSVLSRTLRYSAFAGELTRGNYSTRLEPDGNDELSALGRTLDDLAQRRQQDDLYDQRQFDFTDTLQVADSEQEAHELVKSHLERSVADCTVTILNRNNSADQLQAVTAVDPASPIRHGLESAKPRSCLAIRMTRPHHGAEGVDDLLKCGVCSPCGGETTCTPLLVGGEVIGSILANHPQPLNDQEQRSIRETVIQTAPVLGNLRNLAMAEMRAATDALTGLPNKRALQDTLKRMVAQASRQATPLAALMCDLDHFKGVNDLFGHAAGDAVLAAVAAVFSDTVRASDFAGRYGGEEFLILLPATPIEGALGIAERIRAGVAGLQVPGVEQRITLSIGIAMMPDQAYDAETLAQGADRALYAAKNGGRNRVEVFIPHTADQDVEALLSPAHSVESAVASNSH